MVKSCSVDVDSQCLDLLQGDTALHQAVFREHTDEVKLLITAGADVTAKDRRVSELCF